MSDFITELRRGTLILLKGYAPLTAIVPPSSIHPSTVPANPAWPFTRWDAPQSIPVGVGCTAGAEVSFLVHAFAKERKNSAGATIETAEDHCGRITAALTRALNRRRFDIASGSVHLRVRSTRLMIDGAEADTYHGITDCLARVYAG